MTEVTSVRVYRRHLREAKRCHSGCRTWFAHHGFSWSDFLDNGIEGQKLLDTRDPNAVAVVRIAEQEANRGR